MIFYIYLLVKLLINKDTDIYAEDFVLTVKEDFMIYEFKETNFILSPSITSGLDPFIYDEYAK